MAKTLRKFALLAAASTSVGTVAPVQAQSAERVVDNSGDIIVTARRREERLQDVPISVTVFSQEQIASRNITNATDLSTYTPSLSSNNRFGSDFASYAIRGFTQELRTTASVGVYFAEVVSQRAGQNAVTAGDGAGPGGFFDLENVQVLKGPQGTLFGRNTTGGAVMLTPRRPSDRFEGYIEGSAGNYDMYRVQGVINLPLSDQVRLRLGVDHQKRDGHLRNLSGIGPDRLGAVDYVAGRASLILELGDVENYTVGTFSNSRGTPDISQLFACAPAGWSRNPATGQANDILELLGRVCRDQLSSKDYGFHDVASQITDPISKINSWQVINTTTWAVSDSLTVKNIFAYGELDTRLRSALFGSDFRIPADARANAGTPFIFANINPNGGGKMTDQHNLVEELQLQGNLADNKLVWQAGFYYEHSAPKSFVGNLGNTNIYCPGGGDQTLNPADYRCQDVIRPNVAAAPTLPVGAVPIGTLTSTLNDIAFENIAVYAQATYNLSEEFALTGGLRYTWDKTESRVTQIGYRGFPTDTPGTFTSQNCIKTTATLPDCLQSFEQNSSAPTWLIDLDYKPNPDVLIYAKYARGYRQGSAVAVAADGQELYGPERVDAYELGAKLSLRGVIRGFLNVAAFYNDLRDQQIQIGFSSLVANSTTGILNAGRSRIYGLEIESRLIPLDGLTFDIGYTYLSTKLVDIVVPPLPPGSIYFRSVPSVNKGDPLALSPEHKLALTGTYTLPLPETVGEVSLGATYVYTDEQLTASASPFGRIPSYEIVNLNLTWNRVAGSPVDASFFVTNLFNEKYATYVNGLFTSTGAEYRNVGLPRMWGVRLRYSFGN